MSLDPLSSVISALEREHIIPDVLPESFQPSLLFSIVYPNGKEVLLGNELSVSDTAEEPSINMMPMNIPIEQAEATGEDAPVDLSYTLVMLDPDAPGRSDFRFRSFRHWVVTGLTARSEGISETADFTALQTKASATTYYAPGARAGSGTHRYTFLLFQEPSGFALPPDAPEHRSEKDDRKTWNAVEFGRRYGLTLVGASFFLVHTDSE
ncbi:PEBP-like protein [Auriscalpium vulgare]|uniref:PEBP-like protein n=1 Tax=Auriscalpium vulgare TaxID=40419 RepID=A0ACB8S5N3_9AGAM|nr:PEBP-like protein [Auriscalpium vulgare]